MKQPKAYSYIRFSTPEQLKGNSLQRQIDASDKYCKDNGLTLDTSLNLRDLGLSAYHGTHRQKGALGVFLRLVETGKIEKGSVLIVENLDRLSRQEPMEAFTQFSLIIQAGIKLVTLTDMQEYTKESIKNNQGQLWMSLGTMMRAYQESERKSGLLKSAWQAKRKSGKLVTAKCPAWLKVVKDDKGNKQFKPKPDVVLAIKRIFELKLQGIGEERISIELNTDPGFWQPPKTKRNKEGGWRKSYIAKILRSRAVIGEYTHHQLVQLEEGEEPKADQRFKKKQRLLGTTRQKVSDPIPNYYPPIIDVKTFNRTKYQIEEKLKQTGFAGGKTGKATNLFAHLVRCALCGSPMHYIDKGKPPKGGQYLHCDNSRRNLGCHAKAIRYDEFQDIFFNDLKELDLSKFNPDQEGFEKEVDSIQASIEDYKQQLSDVNKKINHLIDVAETGGDPGLIGRLKERRKEKLEIEKHITDLEHELRAALEDSQNQRKKLDVVKEVKQLLDKAESEDQRINLRLRIRAELQRLVECIKIIPRQEKHVPTKPHEGAEFDPGLELQSFIDSIKPLQKKRVKLDKEFLTKATTAIHISDEPDELIMYGYKSTNLVGMAIQFKGVVKLRVLLITDATEAFWKLFNAAGEANKPIILGSSSALRAPARQCSPAGCLQYFRP